MMLLRTINLITCLASVLLLTACKRPFSDRAQDLSIFRFSENGAPVTMDPVQLATQYANPITTSIYDQLYEYKYLARPYELKPRLAEAIPQPDPRREKEHLSLAGDIPSHNDPPKGCPFQPRYPVANTECAESKPPLKPVDAEDTSSKHQVACWLH